MIRLLCVFFSLGMLPLVAADDAPPIIIHSPDTAATFAFGTIKSRSLVWSDARQTLYVEVTFTDEQQDNFEAEADAHRFRIPGVTLDKAHGIFYATTPQGEAIPVARRKKVFLLSTIAILPNAIVRVHHYRGNVDVTLEAVRPADVAREKQEQDAASGANPDGTHTLNLQDLLP